MLSQPGSSLQAKQFTTTNLKHQLCHFFTVPFSFLAFSKSQVGLISPTVKLFPSFPPFPVPWDLW